MLCVIHDPCKCQSHNRQKYAVRLEYSGLVEKTNFNFCAMHESSRDFSFQSCSEENIYNFLVVQASFHSFPTHKVSVIMSADRMLVFLSAVGLSNSPRGYEGTVQSCFMSGINLVLV